MEARLIYQARNTPSLTTYQLAEKGVGAAMDGRSGPKFMDVFRSGNPFPTSEKAN